MRLTGPLITLTVGAVVGGTLLALSAAAARTDPTAPAGSVLTAPAASASATATPARTGSAVAAPASPPADVAPTEQTPTEQTPTDQAPTDQALTDQALTDQAAPVLQPDDLVAYAGRLPGQRYSLVLALRGDRAVGYLCDGDRVESWLRGSVAADRVSLTGSDGEALQARLVVGHAAGDLTALGRDWSFTLSAVDPASVSAVTAKVAP